MMAPSELIGRDDDLRWLRRLFDQAAGMTDQPRGPRMAVVIGESGLGKTRLVQELYLQLTVDPTWDPPEVNYWPDAFRGLDDQLRVNPDMAGHVPLGPPELLWLGARWQAPTARNVDTRRSALAELCDELDIHAGLVARHKDGWKGVAAAGARGLLEGGAEHLLEEGMDLLVPQASALFKLARGAHGLLRDRSRREASADARSRSAAVTVADRLSKALRGLLHRDDPLPVILWLDDAQWIDADTASWLDTTWRAADEAGWPLLIIATHWEREWHEAAHASSSSVRAFEHQSGVELRFLSAASDGALEALARRELPGLTPTQVAMLVEKASGNFLSMVENVGALRSRTRNFLGSDPQAALSPQGEREVAEWSSEREHRIQQRFRALEEGAQDLLGWGSALGLRFVEGVVADFARREGREASEDIERLVIPYVILCRSRPQWMEFRDRAYHRLACNYFDRYLVESRPRLLEALRDHLTKWMNDSFEQGYLLRGDDATSDSAAGWLRAGRRDDVWELLALARVHLSLASAPDWEDPQQVAALRALRLAVEVGDDTFQSAAVRELGTAIVGIDWAEVPEDILAPPQRDLMGILLEHAGAPEAAVPLFRDGLARAQHGGQTSDILDSLELLSSALAAMGQLGEARDLLEQRVRLAAEHDDVKAWATAVAELCGFVTQQDQDFSEALVAELRRAVVALRDAAASEAQPDTDALDDALHALGVFAGRLGDANLELAVARERRDLAARMITRSPGPVSEAGFVQALLRLCGLLRERESDGAGWEEALAEAERIAARLVSTWADPSRFSLHADVLMERAEGLQASEATPLVREALALQRRAMDAEPTPERAKEFTLTAHVLALALIDSDPAEAEDVSAEALERVRAVLGKRTDDGAKAIFAEALVGHAELLAGLAVDDAPDANPEARALVAARHAVVEEAITIWRGLVDRHPRARGYQESLASSMEALALILQAQDRELESRAAYFEAVEWYRSARPEGSEGEAQALLDACESMLEEELFEPALPLLERAALVAQAVYRRGPTEASAYSWVRALHLRSFVEATFESPVSTFEPLAETVRTLVAAHPGPDLWEQAADVVGALVNALDEAEDTESAATWRRTEVAWREALAASDPERPPSLELGVALNNLADFEDEAGEAVRAAEYARRAISVLEGVLRAAHEEEDDLEIDPADLRAVIKEMKRLVRAVQPKPTRK